MQPPVERRGPEGRGTAGDAARVLAVGAGISGALGGAAASAWAIRALGDAREPTLDGLLLLGAMGAVLSWILAAAAVWTALVSLRRDRGDRLARVALRAAAPGAVAGTIAVLLVAVLLVAESR